MVSKCLLEINAIFRMLLMVKELCPDERLSYPKLLAAVTQQFLRPRVYSRGSKSGVRESACEHEAGVVDKSFSTFPVIFWSQVGAVRCIKTNQIASVKLSGAEK